ALMPRRQLPRHEACRTSMPLPTAAARVSRTSLEPGRGSSAGPSRNRQVLHTMIVTPVGTTPAVAPESPAAGSPDAVSVVSSWKRDSATESSFARDTRRAVRMNAATAGLLAPGQGVRRRLPRLGAQWLLARTIRLQLRGQLRICAFPTRTAFPLRPHSCGWGTVAGHLGGRAKPCQRDRLSAGEGIDYAGHLGGSPDGDERERGRNFPIRGCPRNCKRRAIVQRPLGT